MTPKNKTQDWVRINQELGTQSRSLMWVVGVQVFEPSLAAWQGIH